MTRATRIPNAAWRKRLDACDALRMGAFKVVASFVLRGVPVAGTLPGMLSGSCHCGAVQLEVPGAPPVLTSCNCSICRRLGGLWAYFAPAEVRVTGPTTTYLWGDQALALHRCVTCGCTTHWTPVGDTNPNRMGVNMRMFAPDLVAGLRVRRVDGAADTWAELPD